jgi:hypothetical protein
MTYINLIIALLYHKMLLSSNFASSCFSVDSDICLTFSESIKDKLSENS